MAKAGATGQSVAKALMERVFLVFGTPVRIVSDNDVRFSSDWWAQVLKELGVSHHTTLPHRPQGNGAVERVNGKVLSLLRKLMVNNADATVTWANLLPWVQWVLNDTPGTSGYSPNLLVFGRELVSPGEGGCH